VIDEEVSKLVESQYQRALKTLEDNKEKLTLLAEKLLTHEVIFKEDLIEIFGKRPWDSEEESKIETAEITEVTDTTEALTEGPETAEESTEAPENPEETSSGSSEEESTDPTTER
jgi:hypothetical protein